MIFKRSLPAQNIMWFHDKPLSFDVAGELLLNNCLVDHQFQPESRRREMMLKIKRARRSNKGMSMESWLGKGLGWNLDSFTVKSEHWEGESMSLYNRWGLLSGVEWKLCVLVPRTERTTKETRTWHCSKVCSCPVAKTRVAQRPLGWRWLGLVTSWFKIFLLTTV